MNTNVRTSSSRDVFYAYASLKLSVWNVWFTEDRISFRCCLVTIVLTFGRDSENVLSLFDLILFFFFFTFSLVFAKFFNVVYLTLSVNWTKGKPNKTETVSFVCQLRYKNSSSHIFFDFRFFCFSRAHASMISLVFFSLSLSFSIFYIFISGYTVLYYVFKFLFSFTYFSGLSVQFPLSLVQFPFAVCCLLSEVYGKASKSIAENKTWNRKTTTKLITL